MGIDRLNPQALQRPADSGGPSPTLNQAPGQAGGEGEKKPTRAPKPATMSKLVSSKIQGLSSKLTEIMSWTSKLESAPLLFLGANGNKTYCTFELFLVNSKFGRT